MMEWSVRCVVLSMCVLYTTGAYLQLDENNVCSQKNGKDWICRKLSNCPKASQIINTNKASQIDICSYIGREPVVCCEPEEEVKSISQRKCEEYADAVFIETEVLFFGSEKENTCAAVVEPLIVNGKDTHPREFPHMAQIGYGDKNSISYLCGGSLISERYVLSAAHCTDAGKIGLAKWVRLGEYNTNSEDDDLNRDSSPEIYEIVERINHPEYKQPRLYNDIALYKLSQNVTFNEYIRPCCISYNPEKSYKQGIATGWGHTEYAGRESDILQKVSLNISDVSRCNSSYSQSIGPQLPNGILSESMLCAGDLVNGGDTCQGDSGGPLQIYMLTPYCMYSVIGVTSFGRQCGGNVPGVYTRVSYFIPWIERIVWSS